MKEEKDLKATSGYLILPLVVLFILGGIVSLILFKNPWFLLVFVAGLFFTPGFFFVYPNQSQVMTLFGEYTGTVKANGFYWVNPLYLKKRISLRARNFDSDKVKVNDKLGNPIMISIILVWQVKDTFSAAFEVDDYESFVKVQSDAAVRKLAGMYPYDNFDDSRQEITLRSGLEEVNHTLEEELRDRLVIAGIHVIEARIGYLAYASEIANSMLKRQQATAIVAARTKIVEGAVGMVDMALEELGKKKIVELDEERKAAMISNLMVVLCSDKDVNPVVNTGSLYS
jgi:regulator of protease activity HflC (stomatin/prohibitin superfamily)